MSTVLASHILLKGKHFPSSISPASLLVLGVKSDNRLALFRKEKTNLSLNSRSRQSTLIPLNERMSASAIRDVALMGDQSPVLLFDVMGTIVRDPFYQDIPAFFGISMKELLQIKHPSAWIEFEKGLISEEELIANFFQDQRSFDADGLKTCMANGYEYLEGVESLLDRLKTKGYQMHAFTNYPSWYKLIEDKLVLSKYLTWTFVSCHTGKRKPDPEAFVDAAKHLGRSPSDIIFIDDQLANVEAAIQIGMTGLTFKGSEKLENDLRTLGLNL
ncbi:hypothetical protein KP509_15G060400 [Ceratopteris richardii]|uniref:Uncharacterized protein n=1 Tax=Ceratopteris richardii TaxID=49495 RepID=A0A8T2T3X4_CERRI|nr:hypothetical protein KP509_15G060400 [Ceratopteris richardii]